MKKIFIIGLMASSFLSGHVYSKNKVIVTTGVIFGFSTLALIISGAGLNERGFTKACTDPAYPKDVVDTITTPCTKNVCKSSKSAEYAAFPYSYGSRGCRYRYAVPSTCTDTPHRCTNSTGIPRVERSTVTSSEYDGWNDSVITSGSLASASLAILVGYFSWPFIKAKISNKIPHVTFDSP